MSSLNAVHLLSGVAVNAFAASPAIARRDVNVFEEMEKLGNALMKASSDLPKCFVISPSTAAKEPECAKVFAANLETESQCSTQTFEDEQLGAMKCACKVQQETGTDSLKNAKPCIQAFCKGDDVAKVEKVMNDLVKISLEQCDLLPEYAKMIRDGFTATVEGQVVTIPPAGSAYPTSAFDFITETTKAAKPTNTSTDEEEEEDTSSTSGGAVPVLPTKGANSNSTADEEEPAAGSGAGAFSVKNALTLAVALMPAMAAMLL